MIVELKDKVAAILPPGLEDHWRAGAVAYAGEAMREDVISALLNLGYPKAVAERAISGVMKETPDANFEATLKLALRKLAK
jgi:Holliday junction DNA helicase RuvA